jgi:hypothetical protein
VKLADGTVVELRNPANSALSTSSSSTGLMKEVNSYDASKMKTEEDAEAASRPCTPSPP